MSKNFRKHPLNKNFVWRQPSPPYELITREQAQLYREQGGFVFYDAFDQAELAALLADLDAAENTANEFNKAVAPDQRSISRADEIVFSPHLVTRSNVAKSFAQHPTLVALCRDLIGPRVRLYWDQLVYKRPGTADEFPWHQDNGYTFVEPQQYLTCWVALNDATVENGCPWIAPGVHSNGTLHHKWTNLGFQCFGGICRRCCNAGSGWGHRCFFKFDAASNGPQHDRWGAQGLHTAVCAGWCEGVSTAGPRW